MALPPPSEGNLPTNVLNTRRATLLYAILSSFFGCLSSSCLSKIWMKDPDKGSLRLQTGWFSSPNLSLQTSPHVDSLRQPAEWQCTSLLKHGEGKCFYVKTQCQDEFRILSSRTQKLKLVKWCWKQQSEHNLMYIYHKQCENMQKIQWKSSNGQIQCF